VFAEDLVTRNTYNIHFSVAVGVDEPGQNSGIILFPNPAHERIFTKGLQGADIRFFNITGQLVLIMKDFSENSIDVTSLENGIYTVQVVMENKTVVNKKVTVLK
jgi:hypothetical protein